MHGNSKGQESLHEDGSLYIAWTQSAASSLDGTTHGGGTRHLDPSLAVALFAGLRREKGRRPASLRPCSLQLVCHARVRPSFLERSLRPATPKRPDPTPQTDQFLRKKPADIVKLDMAGALCGKGTRQAPRSSARATRRSSPKGRNHGLCPRR